MRRALVFMLAAALGCATPVASTLYEAPETGPIHKIAVLPLLDDPSGGADDANGAAVITAHLVAALSEETDLEVIPPEEALRSGNGSLPTPAELQRDFGVEGVITGKVRRYSERQGGPSGVTRPAAVWFVVELRSIQGKLLWSGEYQERQEALSDNLLTLGMVWKRGFRWVTAAELAEFGARELARALASDTASWS